MEAWSALNRALAILIFIWISASFSLAVMVFVVCLWTLHQSATHSVSATLFIITSFSLSVSQILVLVCDALSTFFGFLSNSVLLSTVGETVCVCYDPFGCVDSAFLCTHYLPLCCARPFECHLRFLSFEFAVWQTVSRCHGCLSLPFAHFDVALKLWNFNYIEVMIMMMLLLDDIWALFHFFFHSIIVIWRLQVISFILAFPINWQFVLTASMLLAAFLPLSGWPLF